MLLSHTSKWLHTWWCHFESHLRLRFMLIVIIMTRNDVNSHVLTTACLRWLIETVSRFGILSLHSAQTNQHKKSFDPHAGKNLIYQVYFWITMFLKNSLQCLKHVLLPSMDYDYKNSYRCQRIIFLNLIFVILFRSAWPLLWTDVL